MAVSFPAAGTPTISQEAQYLQPQTAGLILRNSCSIYISNWLSACLIYVLPMLPFIVLHSILVGAEYQSLAMLVSFLQSFLSLLAGAALVVLVSDICLGLKPNLGRAFRLGFHNPKLIGTYLLTWLYIFAGLCLLIVPGLVLSVRFMFMIPAVVLDGYSYRDAMRRSRELGRGWAWRNIGVFSLASVAFLGLLVLILFPMAFALIAVDSSEALADFFMSLVVLALTPVFSIPVILLYYDMRARKEGFGAAQLMEELRF